MLHFGLTVFHWPKKAKVLEIEWLLLIILHFLCPPSSLCQGRPSQALFLGLWTGMFSSCLRSNLNFYLEKTTARFNFQIDLGTLHTYPGVCFIKQIMFSNLFLDSSDCQACDGCERSNEFIGVTACTESRHVHVDCSTEYLVRISIK